MKTATADHAEKVRELSVVRSNTTVYVTAYAIMTFGLFQHHKSCRKIGPSEVILYTCTVKGTTYRLLFTQ